MRLEVIGFHEIHLFNSTMRTKAIEREIDSQDIVHVKAGEGRWESNGKMGGV